MFETAVNDNHVFSLIKRIGKSYCKIKLHHLGKEYTNNIAGINVKKKFGKLVLFKGQRRAGHHLVIEDHYYGTI